MGSPTRTSDNTKNNFEELINFIFFYVLRAYLGDGEKCLNFSFMTFKSTLKRSLILRKFAILVLTPIFAHNFYRKYIHYNAHKNSKVTSATLTQYTGYCFSRTFLYFSSLKKLPHVKLRTNIQYKKKHICFSVSYLRTDLELILLSY